MWPALCSTNHHLGLVYYYWPHKLLSIIINNVFWIFFIKVGAQRHLPPSPPFFHNIPHQPPLYIALTFDSIRSMGYSLLITIHYFSLVPLCSSRDLPLVTTSSIKISSTTISPLFYSSPVVISLPQNKMGCVLAIRVLLSSPIRGHMLTPNYHHSEAIQSKFHISIEYIHTSATPKGSFSTSKSKLKNYGKKPSKKLNEHQHDLSICHLQ